MSNFFRMMLCALMVFSFSYQKTEALNHSVVQVGIDNAGQPIKYGITVEGENDGRPTILFFDPYFGVNAWRCYQAKYSDQFYTIAIDVLGSGTSTKNDPAAMDGVLGLPGYSFAQQSQLMHILLQTLGVQGPITWCSCDTQALTGMHYALDFKNDPLAISRLVLINSAPKGITSDDPCSLAFVTSAGAEGLSQAFAAAPCQTLCALLANSFLTTDNPDYGKTLLDASVAYSMSIPPAVFRRWITQTYVEDATPLMKLITIPTLSIYGGTSDNNPLSRQSLAITFTRYCTACPGNNPLIPGVCPCPQTFIEPFPDNRFLVYPGHGTCTHLSAFKRFSKDLKKFILGKDSACTPCPLNLHIPLGECPSCS